MVVSTTGFPMVKLGNFKDTMKTVFPSPWMEDSRMHTKCRIALQPHLHQERFLNSPVYPKCCAVLQRLRAKNSKTSM